MRRTRVFLASLFSTALLFGATAAPASAQQAGLVNVEISNVLNNNQIIANVIVPINAAANICGVSVNVLSQQLQQGPVNCEADAAQGVDFRLTAVQSRP